MMNVLFFCPISEKSNAEQVLTILQESSIEPDRLFIDTIDESNSSFSLENRNYSAIIIVFTPEVELSAILYEIVHNIDQNKPPGRFIFLPMTGGKEIFPPVFHPIRALQLRLYYYLSGQSSNHLETQLMAFNLDWQKFYLPVQDQPRRRRGSNASSRHAGFGFILLASFLILFLVGLIAVLIPTVQRTILPAAPTSPHSPVASVFWLQESFKNLDTTARWQKQHYYNGQQPIQTTFSSTGMRLSADPMVSEAVFQLDSQQIWPLDDLQSLSFSFALSALNDPAAKSALVIGLFLSEDSSYRLDCLIIPASTNGMIQCQVQSPTQVDALSAAVLFSLDAEHTATLAFDPSTYTVQFFLDDQFYGQNEIRSVEYWRTRSFKLHIRNQVQDMSSGSYSCELYSIFLAYQP
jgi:hypothetical protein